ncbi:serine-rich adhesin for platelets [Filimonas sp.]|nr:serine-rich adhesin for platelets [Filimonas sp.]
MKKLLFILVFSLAVIVADAQVINITGIGVTGRFNTCNGSNIPAISASLISTSGGASVSGGLFTCLNPCDSSTIRVTISNAKWNKSPNNEWLHGLFLPASAGFSVSPVSIPPGFLTYNNGCVGTCPSGSGSNGGPGFYFDNSNGNSCCGTVTANDGFPCNNYGDATMACNAALSMTFDLTFCNSIITTSSHQFIVTGSSDGETGCWNFNDGLPHKITFTIPTVPCTPGNINPSATLPVRTCIGNTVNYTSTLTGTCNASSVYWWDAAIGGNLVGTGSPFVYDPAGSSCPVGTTLYATCCSGINTTCVPRVPVTIPGVCNPLSISAASTSNTICGVLGAVNSVTVVNGQGAIIYTLDPGGIINSSGVFTGLNQNAYTVTAGDATGCTATTLINILQPAPIAFSLPLITNTTCIDPSAGQIIVTASGGVGVLTYSINPVSTQALPGIFTGLTAQSYTITATDITNCTATTLVTLATPAQPIWNTVSGVGITCHGANDGSIQAIAAGGSGLLSYTLQPSGIANTSGTFNGLNGTVYTIQVSDANGCGTTTTVNIVDPPVLVWSNINMSPTSCSYLNDGAFNALATGGTSSIQYQLLPSGSLNSSGVFTGLSAGNYTVQAMDANNCSITALITILAAPSIVFANPIITSPLCHGGVNGQLSMAASGGTGSMTYSLNPTGTSNTIGIFSSLSAGNYTVTATDNNTCSNTTTVSISEPTALQFSSNSLTSPSCNSGTNGSINVLAAGGTGIINYTLQPSGNSNNTGSFISLSSGSYTVTASDVNGCTLSTILLMTQPPVLNWTSATGNTVSCNGGNNGSITSSVIGGTGSISYTIQPGAITNTTGNFSSLLANTYTIQASDANGCTTSTTVLITQPTPVLWTSVNNTNVQCNGASDATISISASGGSGIITYSLFPTGTSNTNGVFTGLTANNFTIQATDANGCSLTTNINISQPTALLINNINNTAPSCVPGNDATITINAGGGTLTYSYSIGGPSQAGNSFSNIGAGNYTITVTDAHNCTVTSVQTVITPNGPVITSSSSSPVSCFGGNNGSIQVTSSGGTGIINYTLQPGNITNTSGNFNSLTAFGYSITATDILGCSASTSVLVTQPPVMNWTSATGNTVSCNGGNNGSITSSVIGGTGSISYTIQPGAITNTTGNFSSLLANTYTIQASDANGCTTSTTVLITQPTPVLWTSVNNTNVQCNGASDATISISASGGSGIITYSLFPTGTSNTNGVYTGLTANNFTMQATDANGCSITTNINISQPTALLINNINNTAPSCVPGNDATITINAGGGTLTYSYSIGGPSQAGNSFSNIGAGNYTITVTDAHNCTVTSVQAVITPNGPVITSSSSSPVSCFGGNNGSIQVTSSGGTGIINYTLQPGNITNTSGNFNSLTAFGYSIAATDILGCSASTSVLVTQPPAMNWTSATGNTVSCNGGNNGSITSSVIGGTGSISYTIQPGAITNTTGNFSSLLANTYTIQASDANGCTTSTTVLITQPTPVLWTSVNNTNVQCNGASDATISISASGGSGIITYSLFPTGTSNTNGVFTGLTANNFTIQATDANGCSITTNINISQPTALLINNINNTAPSCVPGNDATITINAGGGTLTYSYSIGGPSQAGNSFSNIGAGNYTITVTDAHNCTVTSVQAVITPNAPVITSVLTTNASCIPGNDATLIINATGGTGIYSYAVNSSSYQSSNFFTGLGAGTYTVLVKDGSACTGSSIVTLLTQNSPTVTAVATTLATCLPGCDATASITASGISSSLFTYSLDAISFQTSPIFNLLCTGQYTVTVKDGNGCAASSLFNILTANGPLISNSNITDVLCHGGNNGLISVQTIGGSGSINYTLQPSGIQNTNGTFTSLVSNTYTVTATDINGCTTLSIASVTEPTLLQFSNISASATLCSGMANGTLNALAIGGSGTINYNINPSATFVPPSSFSNLNGNTTYTMTAIDANNCSVTTAVFIPQAVPISILNTASVNISCHGANDGSINISAIGGTGLLTYTLQPGATTNSTGAFSNLSGSVYTVTISDANNCTISTLLAVTDPPAISLVSMNSIHISCTNLNDGSIAIVCNGGLGNLTYSLQPGSVTNTTGVFSGLSGNTYTITATDATNCTYSSTTVISNPAPLVFNNISSTNVLCFGDSNGTVNVSAAGGTGLYTYQINPLPSSNTNGLFITLPAAVYTVTVNDANNCSNTTILSVTQPNAINALLVSTQNVTCYAGLNGACTIIANGGISPYIFTLQPGAVSNNNGLFTGLTAGIYSVQVTDSNACSTIVAPIQISQPQQILWNSISHQDILCFGDVNGVIQANASGGVGSFSYVLWPTAGTPTTPGTFIDLPVNTYTVIATDASGCSISTVVAITQNPDITFTRIDFKLPTCHGDDDGSLMADAVGGVAPFIFQLNTSLPATTAYFTNLKSGLYTLTVTDAVGCKKDTVVFLDQPDVVMAAAIDITPVSCKEVNDGEIKVYGTGGTGALTYYLNTAWMINKTGEFTELPQGGYNLTIKDSLGCVFDTVLTVPLPDPMSLIITKKDLGCTGVGKEGWAEANVIGGEPPYSFTWSTNPPQFTSTIHDLYFGIYFVDVADVNGCSTRDTVYIAPGTCCEQVFIPNAFSPNGDGINDVFKVTTTAGIDLLQFSVYDRWGNKVWSTTDFRAAWDGTYKKKEENMDTFFYIFWYTCLTDGQKYMRKGDVMIVR